MRRLLIPLLLVLVTSGGILVSVERGNRLFRAGKYADAVEAYRAALADGEESPTLRYNLGTALLKLGRYEEAEEQLRAALEQVDPATRDRAYHNLGQRYLEDARQSGEPEASLALYDAAVESYRQALRLSPDDPDTKWNYELSLRERDEQQQSGGGGGQDQQDQQNQEQQQDQQPQQGDQGQGGSSQGQNQPSSGAPEAPGDGARAPLTEEQAERILSAVEQDERELFRDKLRKGQQRTRTDRDW
jgi:tetratricopeptide (TPR) repeat protein